MHTNSGWVYALGIALLFGVQCVSGAPFANEVLSGCTPIAATVGQSIELDQPSHYCLQSDIEWANVGPALLIKASDIRVNLMSHLIRGVPRKHGQIGILVDSGSSDIVIENGSIVSMKVGIRAHDVTRLSIADMNISNISWIGVHISGLMNAVLRSRLEDIGYMDDGENDDGYAVGILADGKQMRIIENYFHNVTRQPVPSAWTSEGVSILLSEGSEDFLIQKNTFTNRVENAANTIGVWARTNRVTIVENQFTDCESPIQGDYLGETVVSKNEFNIGSLGPLAFDKVDDRARFIAVAMRMSESSTGRFGRNTFTGYACPIQFFGKPKRQALSIEDNTISWPKGPRFCKNVGVWYSRESFGPLQSAKTGRSSKSH